jgi:hypothetical protein
MPLRPEPRSPRPDRRAASAEASPAANADSQKAIRELLDLLPPDIVQDLNRGDVDVNDPAFFEGLTDHVARQSMADPQKGRRLLSKLIKLKKLIGRELRESHPEAASSSTVTRATPAVGRNVPCPCGSGKKFKHCCLRKR